MVWTNEDVQNFIRLIAEHGGKVISILEHMDGGYTFNVRGIETDELNRLMKDFDRNRS